MRDHRSHVIQQECALTHISLASTLPDHVVMNDIFGGTPGSNLPAGGVCLCQPHDKLARVYHTSRPVSAGIISSPV